jgi:hypothetical protein
LAFVEHHPNSDTLTKNRAERGLAELSAQLLPEEIASARQVGQSSDLEPVVAEIIGEMDRGDN